MTQMKRHRAVCDVWKARDKSQLTQERTRSTLQKKHGPGITNPIHIAGSRAKKAATMKERYGAENPFSRESSLFEQVQSHWNGKDRTAHLPKDNFSRPEVKEKIRQHWQDNFGVNNGSQVPEIRAKQLATTLERYGDEQGLRVPEIRAKGAQTVFERFGVFDAAQSPDVLERIRQTNLSKYGVEWTTQDPRVLEKLRQSHFSKYGSWYSSTPDWKAAFLSNIESHQSKVVETNLERYRVRNYMSDPQLAARALQHSRRSGPNSLERRLQELFPSLLFTGDGSFWKFLPRLGRNKNPDFVLPGPHPDSIFRDASVAVEVFGSYWHGEAKTGKSVVEHELETVAAWNDVGFKCLVVWEPEFKDERRMIKRIEEFLARAPSS